MMAAVPTDLAVESEVSTVLSLRLTAAFDAKEPLARLLTPIAKYGACKRPPGMVYEAMEWLADEGHLESDPMPRGRDDPAAPTMCLPIDMARLKRLYFRYSHASVIAHESKPASASTPHPHVLFVLHGGNFAERLGEPLQ